MKMGEKLTFVNFIKRITDGWVKIFFRQDVMEWVGLVKCVGALVEGISACNPTGAWVAIL